MEVGWHKETHDGVLSNPFLWISRKHCLLLLYFQFYELLQPHIYFNDLKCREFEIDVSHQNCKKVTNQSFTLCIIFHKLENTDQFLNLIPGFHFASRAIN